MIYQRKCRSTAKNGINMGSDSEKDFLQLCT